MRCLISSLLSLTIPRNNLLNRRISFTCVNSAATSFGVRNETTKETGLPSEESSIYEIDVFETHPRTVEKALKHCVDLDVWMNRHTVSMHTRVAYQEACDFVDAFYNSTEPQVVILGTICLL